MTCFFIVAKYIAEHINRHIYILLLKSDIVVFTLIIHVYHKK